VGVVCKQSDTAVGSPLAAGGGGGGGRRQASGVCWSEQMLERARAHIRG